MRVRTNKVRIDAPLAVVYVWYEQGWAATNFTIQVDVVVGDADLKAHARFETDEVPTTMMLGKVAADVYLAWKETIG